MNSTTLHGPRGARLVVDPSQDFPDDPGAGTPLMVHWKQYSGTYHCVVDTGEIDGMYAVPQVVLDWLASDAVLDRIDSIFRNHLTEEQCA